MQIFIFGHAKNYVNFITKSEKMYLKEIACNSSNSFIYGMSKRTLKTN